MKPVRALSRFAPLLIAFAAVSATLVPSDYEQRKQRAEKSFAEGSYARAEKAFRALDTGNLPEHERRWIEFRVQDAAWRSESLTQKADKTKLNAAQTALLNTVRDVNSAEGRDRIYAEISESLGDFHWSSDRQRNWGQAWQQYQKALDWWAGSAAIDEARLRYIRIIKKILNPKTSSRHYYYGYFGNYLPIDVARSFLEIAQSDEDKAHANYAMAMGLYHRGGSAEHRALVPDYFEAALKIGKRSDWYDDAMVYYAQWMANTGRIVPSENGGWRYERDYVKALEIYRRLVREFKAGETRHHPTATSQIKVITGEALNVSVTHFFVPGSEIQYQLNSRNVKSIAFSLYPTDLTQDLKFRDNKSNTRAWLQSVDLDGIDPVHAWTHETKDDGRHRPASEQLRLEKKLTPGAYVLEAKTRGLTRREIVLVSEDALVLKSNGKQALVYFCDAADGAPVVNADVKLWARHYRDRRWVTRSWNARTDADGLARFEVTRADGRNPELFAAASSGERQAYTLGRTSYYNRGQQSWKIYAFTDRPAYRPDEKVEWKLVARTYDGSKYSTPAGAMLEFEIRDPRGTKVMGDKISLNEFGSAWRSLELKKHLPLGEYQVQFWTANAQGRQGHVGSAKLFRLEEYKLPEFKVTVEVPEENGRKKVFRVGDRVEATIQADYYFGGPVANANVEVLVHQKSHHHYWPRPREFPWFYEDMNPRPSGGRGNRGNQIKREVLKTDAEGKVTVFFDTPQGAGQDFNYEIEARVTDASRREIRGTGSITVARQRYYVSATPAHNIYRPQSRATVNFRSQDANGEPYPAEGEVVVTRDYWYEIWIAPDGREVKGPELLALKRKGAFPPPAVPNRDGWQIKFRGYEHEEISRQKVKTNEAGEGELSFTPARDGYYRVNWKSEDVIRENPRLAKAVTTATTVWVADLRTTALGYQHGDVQIILDKDTFRVGETAPVMLMTPANDRYVLFSSEAEDLYSYQLVRMTGTVKLLQLEITERDVPNIYLTATMVHDRKIHGDSKQVVVPPTKNFLNVELSSDQEEYEARDEGELTVKTTDHDGNPVSAEVSLGLVDESVYYIQSDYAGDPRKFYFGRKRGNHTANQSTFNQKQFVRLVFNEKRKQLMTAEAEKALSAKLGSRSQVGKSEMFDFEGGQMDSSEGFARGGMSFSNGMAAKTVSAPMAMSIGNSMPMDMSKQAATPSGGMRAPRKKKADVSLGEVEVQVRTDFRSTVLWQPDVKTGPDGTAKVKLKFPDSLTSWKATARVASKGNQFGIAETTTRTRQPLIVRLQAPRFFVTGDRTVVSAVINNNTKKNMRLTAALEVGGAQVLGQLADESRKGAKLIAGFSVIPHATAKPTALAEKIRVPANSEQRIDWLIETPNPGDVKLKVTAFNGTGKSADAMQRSYVAHEHGIEKFIAKSGKIRGDDIRIKLNIPKERKKESTTLSVQVTPSMAVTMLDALPYLIDYPYGCTEQTMSRFLPAAITARTLKDLGLETEDVMGRVFGGIEPAHVNKTQPKGKRNLNELNGMIAKGLERLYDFQHSDGGWGWWKEGSSDHWMTAYVVWGLNLAGQAGIEVKDGVTRRGADFLNKRLVEEELNPAMQAWMLHALALHKKRNVKYPFSDFQKTAFQNLWNKRDELNAYTRALLALSAHCYDRKSEAKILARNLENGVIEDKRPDTSILVAGQPKNKGVQGTAHWGNDGIYWRWSEGGVEATAFALRALLTISPNSKLIDPVTNWLIKNRRGAQWSNTRDTAIVVLAMNDYLKVSGELKSDMEFEVVVNGKQIAKRKLSGADILKAPSRFTIEPANIRDGNNDIRIRRTGVGPIYFAAEATFFSLEEPIPEAGNEIFVKREYFRLVGRPTLLKGHVYDKVKLRDGETVKSGDRIETVLTIEAKNNYEYLLFEDLKPAGFEAVQIRSGESLHTKEINSAGVQRRFAGKTTRQHVVVQGDTYYEIARDNRTKLSEIGRLNPGVDPKRLKLGQVIIVPRPPATPEQTDYTGRSRWVYQELRDRKVAMFIDKLPEGIWEIRYDLRAEVPGRFHALPVLGHAMYVPEIRCNGAEIRVTVKD